MCLGNCQFFWERTCFPTELLPIRLLQQALGTPALTLVKHWLVVSYWIIVFILLYHAFWKLHYKALTLYLSRDLSSPSWVVVHLWLPKGVALQYILYSDLRPRSRRKSKAKVGFLVGQKSSIDFLVYTTIDTFRDSCVNVILQKFTRDWTRVEHDF